MGLDSPLEMHMKQPPLRLLAARPPSEYLPGKVMIMRDSRPVTYSSPL